MRIRPPLSLWRVPPWPEHASARGPVILLYHSVAKVGSDPWGLRVSPRNFAEQMAVLRTHTKPIHLNHLDRALSGGEMPPRSVAVTFDDGFADNLHQAKPVLERHAIPATIFVATGYVGSQREYWWDELDRLLLAPGRLPERIALQIGETQCQWDLGAASNYSRLQAWRDRRWKAWHEHDPTARHTAYRAAWQLLRQSTTAAREKALEELRQIASVTSAGRVNRRCVSIDELHELARGDLIEIGAHTVTHPSLGAIRLHDQRSEIMESKTWLERTLNRPIMSFSYPFGTREDYTTGTIELLRQAGFERSCSNFPGVISREVDRYQLPRRVVLDWDGREFISKLKTWFAEQ